MGKPRRKDPRYLNLADTPDLADYADYGAHARADHSGGEVQSTLAHPCEGCFYTYDPSDDPTDTDLGRID